MLDARLRGRLLVANPGLPDPNFDRTVVLILAHEDEGALGLVLNRPTEMDVDSPLPRWEHLAADPRVVFVGGPVSPGAAICLARVPVAGVFDPDVTEGWAPVTGELGTLDLEKDPEDLDISVEEIRVFAGYAGWGAGQLEEEIEAGAWFVLSAEPGDIMSCEPEMLWKRVLRRQGGDLAIIAAFPPDPNLN
jgi:putative transcriptional regulator